MKIQRADSPTSPRDNFFLPIGDDRERPRSPELLYPPIANIAEVMNIEAFYLGTNYLLQLCFATVLKESKDENGYDRGICLCAIEGIIIFTTFATALVRTVKYFEKYFARNILRSFLAVLIYIFLKRKFLLFERSLFPKCFFVRLQSTRLGLSRFLY